MFACSHIAKYFIACVDEDAGDSISNMKLQKLLYYGQGFHLAIYGTPLFGDAIKRWAHGPVVPQIWHDYKNYGSGPIPVEGIDRDNYPEEIRALLDEVYSVYGQFTASKLRDMTHQEPPWRDTPENGVISHDSMKQFFKTIVIEDEEVPAAAIK
jgi:uncharacterized phage-associated protein